MVALPCATVAASPALLTVAMPVADELQVAVLVRSCVVALLYVPRAVNCRFSPSAIDVSAGVTAIDVSATTVRVVDAMIEPALARIVVTPAEEGMATP